MLREYQGRVFSGVGRASLRVQQNLELYLQVSGMDLIPGTHNVRLSEEYRIPEESIYIGPDKIEPAEKNRGVAIVLTKLNGIEVVIIIPDESGYDKKTIEIMAPFNIRERFGLADGSIITIMG